MTNELDIQALRDEVERLRQYLFIIAHGCETPESLALFAKNAIESDRYPVLVGSDGEDQSKV